MTTTLLLLINAKTNYQKLSGLKLKFWIKLKIKFKVDTNLKFCRLEINPGLIGQNQKVIRVMFLSEGSRELTSLPISRSHHQPVIHLQKTTTLHLSDGPAITSLSDQKWKKYSKVPI